MVDANPGSRDALRRDLADGGYEVHSCESGKQAPAAVVERRPDLVMINVDSDGVDGVAVCRHLRRRRNRVPILMLGSGGSVDERVEGLEAGADDFMVRPFAVAELRARVHALLRRAEPSSDYAPLAFAEISLDTARYGALVDDQFTQLTHKEYQLLELLLLNPRRVLSHGEIFHGVWGYDPASGSNTMRVYIGYLRRNLRSAGARELIHTVRSVGYVLREP